MKRICLLLLSLIVLFSCAPRQLTAEVIGELEIDGAGLVGGAVAGKIYGTSYLFLAYRHQVDILDISNPGVPAVISHIDVPLHFPDSLALIRSTDIELSGTTLYISLLVGSNSGGLWLVDVSEPLSPREITTLPLEYVPFGIDISDNIACISTFSPNGFTFFDISEPHEPRLVNEIVYPFPKQLSVPSKRFQLTGSTLYVLDGNGLVTIDITDPAFPREINFYVNPDWDEKLVIDATVPTYQPKSFLNFVVSGQYAYITASEAGLRVLNLTDPSSPHEVAHLEITNSSAVTPLIAGNLIYLLERNLEIKTKENHSPFAIRIVNITNLQNPETAGILEQFADYPFHYQLIKEDNHLFFPCRNTLYVINTKP